MQPQAGQGSMARGLYGAEAWVRGWQGSFPYGRQRWRCAPALPWPAPAECPGNPDALGTSRTIVVDPREHIRIGTMDYAETLPLRDREVVLTFDDGPIPPYTGKVLDILAAECVKATYFIVGTMAREYPALVRRAYAEGHTIGTHSMTPSFPLPGAVGRARQCPDRRWHRGDRGGSGRCRQARAVFPVSGLWPHRARPRTRRLARIDGLGRRRAGRRLA